MKLNIPPLGQRNPQWGDKLLGFSTSKIKDYGCLLICHSMLLTYYGHEFFPDTLNEFYKNRKVFDKDLINFWAAATCFDDIKAEDYVECSDIPAPLEKIDLCLSQGKPVIAMVDFSPKVGVQSHFVLIIGKDNDYLINDPWMGETYYFTAKYGDPAKNIYGLRIYSGPVKEVGESVESLLERNKELSSRLSDEIKANAELRSAIVQKESTIKGYEEESQKLLEDNRKAEIEKENAKKDYLGVLERYQSLELEHQAFLKAYTTSEDQILEKLSFFKLIKTALGRIVGKRR